MLRIAHVSDLHVLSPRGVELRRVLFNKRMTGYANLVLRRGRMYRRDYLEAVLAAAAQRADHVVVTGDVTNLSLESEYAEARRLLDEIARVTEVTVVPGNHDIYLPSTARGRRFWHHFEPFLRGDLPELAIDLPAGRFPCVKLRGPAAFIALSSAVPRPPFVSAGYVGRAQLDALRAALAHPEVARRVPVVLVHHDPTRLAPAPRAAPERARRRERAAQRSFECRARTRPLRPPPRSPSQPAHDGGGRARTWSAPAGRGSIIATSGSAPASTSTPFKTTARSRPARPGCSILRRSSSSAVSYPPREASTTVAAPGAFRGASRADGPRVMPGGDTGERADRRPRPVGCEGRGRGAAMVAGDAAAQGGRPDAEAQRRFEDERLAVDAGGHGGMRVDLERRRGPRPRRRLATRRAQHGDTEDAVVEVRSHAGSRWTFEPVAVVRYDDRGAALVLVPVGAAPPQIRLPSGAQDVRHRVEHACGSSRRGSRRAGPPPRTLRARRC